MRSGRVVEAHLDLRREHHLLDFKICEARNAGQLRAKHFRLSAQRVQIFAKQLDGYLRAHAREHVIDTVRNRLPNRDGTRQIDQSRSNFSGYFTHGPLDFTSGFEPDIELAHVNALGVLVEFSSTGAPTDVRHLGNLFDQHLRLTRERHGLG